MKNAKEAAEFISNSKKQTTDSANLSHLERKILGENMVLAHSLIQLENIFPQLDKLVGTKIVTANGSWAAKFKIELVEFEFYEPFNMSYRCYFDKVGRSLWFHNDITIKDKNYEGGGCGVSYYKKSYFLGDTDGQVLESVKHFSESGYSFDLYSIEEIKNLIEEKKKLAEKIDRIDSKLKAFKHF